MGCDCRQRRRRRQRDEQKTSTTCRSRCAAGHRDAVLRTSKPLRPRKPRAPMSHPEVFSELSSGGRATVWSSKIAVENHMNILERRFLRCRPLSKLRARQTPARNPCLRVEGLHVCCPVIDAPGLRHLAGKVQPPRRLSVETRIEHPRIKAFCVFDAMRWTRASWPASSHLDVRASWFKIRVADTYKD